MDEGEAAGVVDGVDEDEAEGIAAGEAAAKGAMPMRSAEIHRLITILCNWRLLAHVSAALYLAGWNEGDVGRAVIFSLIVKPAKAMRSSDAGDASWVHARCDRRICLRPHYGSCRHRFLPMAKECHANGKAQGRDHPHSQ